VERSCYRTFACPSVGRSVDLSVHLYAKCIVAKTADWIRMPFRVLSWVGRGMGVLDGVVIVKGEGAVLGVNLEHPIVANGDFVAQLCGS